MTAVNGHTVGRVNGARAHGEFLSWRGNLIHVSSSGQGEPLLLVQGLGNSLSAWQPFVAEVTNRRIICLDAPGTGRSTTPLFTVPIPALADLLAAVLDKCGEPWADVVGFSYGGAIAQQFAFSHPHRIRRLVLAATFIGVGSVPGSPAAMLSLSTPLRYYSRSYAERTAALTSGGATARNAGTRRQIVDNRRAAPPSSYGYALQLLSMVGWSSWPFLHRIPHETLVIAGDDDPLVPLANAELLAARIPRARLEVVPGGGHLLLWDDAPNLVDRIGQFIALR